MNAVVSVIRPIGRIANGALACGVLLLSSLPALARGVDVQVWYDTNGDGLADPGETGVPQVLISDGDRVVRTDEMGHARVEPLRQDAPARLFVIVPGGQRPTTPWQVRLDAGAADPPAARFGLRPAPERDAPFALTADLHLAAGEPAATVGAVLDELAPRETPPAFVTLVGDLTLDGDAAALGAWRLAITQAAVPVYPVFGAHDGGQSGVARWEAELAPAWYAFWSGGRCFLALVTEPDVLTGQQQARQLRWLRRLLAALPDGAELVTLSHVPPAAAELAQLTERQKLRAVCYGNWHENTVFTRGGVPFVCTGPYRGDDWGAGTGSFRRVSLTADTITAPVIAAGLHRWLDVRAPSPLQPPERVEWPLRVLAYDSVDEVVSVTARLDEAAPLALRRAGRFGWRLDLPATQAAKLSITARARSGAAWEQTVEVPAPRAAPPVRLAGAPPRPPLTRVWLAATGVARFDAGGPAYADGCLYLGLPDDDLPSAPALVCLDAVTGRERWRTPTPGSVYGEPVVAGGRVLALTAQDQAIALDARGGQLLWRRDLTPTVPARHHASRTGVAVQGNRLLAQVGGGPLVSLDPATGAVRAQVELDGAHWAGPAVAGDLVIAPTLFGLVGLDAATLARRWFVACGLRRHGPVTLAGGLACVVGSDQVLAVDPAGRLRWRLPLPTRGLNLGAVTVADGVAYTPGGAPAAVTLSSGAARWSEAPAQPAPAATSAAVAGGLVWSAGDDGSLVARQTADGREVWRVQLGCPVKSGPLIVGSTLFVVDAAGDVHALVSQEAP